MNAQATSTSSGLPKQAWSFIATTGLAAGGLGALAVHYPAGTARGWQAFLILAAAASITQLFAFHTIRNQVFHTTPLFFVAGAVLLKPQYALLLPLVSHVGDWIKHRYPWYIQTFNILNFTLAVMAAWWAARLVTDHWLTTSAAWALGAGAAALVYVLVNNAGFATILFLARGHSPGSILVAQVIAADAALASLGIAFASFWRDDPWLIPFALAPVFLLHEALHLPQLREEARVDPKTELFNARHFGEGLNEELGRARRFGRPLSVVVADVDLLRNLNSTHGHLAGDAVLRGIADVIRSHLRDYDVAARLGGEEFAIILPETTRDEALELAERIREGVASGSFWAASIEEHVTATLSLGVAAFPDDGTDATALVNAADLAAYRGKLHGRNRVVGASKAPELFPVGRIAAAEALRKEQPAARRQQARDVQRRVFRAPQRLRPVVVVLAGIGIAGGALGAVFGTNHNILGLLAVAGFVAVTHLFALRLDHGSISVSAVGVLAGAALFGPTAALPLAVAVAAVDLLIRRVPWSEIFLDVGAISLGSLAAAGIFAIAPAGAAGDAARIPLSVVAGIAYLAVLAVVYGLADAAEARDPWWRGWQTRFAGILPHYAACGFVAGVMASGYRRADVYALAAFAVPLLAVRETQSAFLDHAQTNAKNFQDASEAIHTQNISLRRVNQLLRKRSAAAIESLCAVVDARDVYVAGHSRRVRDLSLLIGRELGLSDADLDALGHAALFHDIGKLAVSDAILLKPAPLSADEWRSIFRHPQEGAEIIERLGFLDDAVPAIRHHHECFDGTGYPDGLAGEDIPLAARIFHVANAYDSMCTNRIYQPQRSGRAALAEIRSLTGSQFCPRCVGAFESALGAAPQWRRFSSDQM
jgi:diguanylate cyclase (GGDEF)-like protein/putative nucleotidyltransferase with HDIG domain